MPFSSPFYHPSEFNFPNYIHFLQPYSPGASVFWLSLQSYRPHSVPPIISLLLLPPYSPGQWPSNLQGSNPLMALANISMQMTPKSTITPLSSPFPKFLPGTEMPLSELVHCVASAFKMAEQVEQRIRIKFGAQLEHSSAETIPMIQ